MRKQSQDDMPWAHDSEINSQRPEPTTNYLAFDSDVITLVRVIYQWHGFMSINHSMNECHVDVTIKNILPDLVN